MKLYVKKEAKNIEYVLFLIFIFIVFIISLRMYLKIVIPPSYNESLALKQERMNKDYSNIIPIVILTGAITIIHIVLYFKKPVPYKAKLILKRIENYNNKNITYMDFMIDYYDDSDINLKKKILRKRIKQCPMEYTCYTIGENNLELNRTYLIYLNEFYFKAKFIEDITNDVIKNV